MHGDQLPTPVVWNRDKPHLGPQFTEAWVDENPTEFLRRLPSSHPLDDFVDRAELLATIDDDPDDREEWRIQCMSLGLWLEATASR